MPTTNQQKYDSTNPLRQGLVGRFQRRLIDVIIHLKPHSILEVGCGEGHVLAGIRRRLDQVSLLGLDINDDALAQGRSLFPMLRLEHGDIYHLDQPDHSWDVVIASEVLEHLDRPEMALQGLRRVARKHIVLSVPHEPWFRLGNLSHGRHLRRLGNHPEHINLWTRRGFAGFVGRSLTVDRVTGSFPWTIVVAHP